jgi:hypothetical protein
MAHEGEQEADVTFWLENKIHFVHIKSYMNCHVIKMKLGYRLDD